MDAIQALRQEREALLARVRQIDVAISEYEEWVRRWGDMLAPRTDVSSAVVTRRGDDTGVTTAEEATLTSRPLTQHLDARDVADTKPTPIPDFEKATYTLLEEIAEPLSRSTLLSALRERGVVVGGADERNTLSARLSRLDGVTNIKGHGYWLARRPYPTAAYFGDTQDPRERSDDDGDIFS